MKKRIVLLAGVLTIGMAMSGSVWAEEAATENEESLGSMLSSLFTEDGPLNGLLGEGGVVEEILNNEDVKTALVGEGGPLAGVLPEDADLSGILGAVTDQLQDANSDLYQTIDGVVGMVQNEDGSLNWDQLGETIGSLAGAFGGEEGTMNDEDLGAYMAQAEALDQVMFDYLADWSADSCDPGDVQIPARSIAQMDDVYADEIRVLGEFSQSNYTVDGDALTFLSGYNVPLLLTLTKGEDGSYTVTSLEEAEDGEGYADSLEAMCQEVGITSDDYYGMMIFGGSKDVDALVKYMEEHPEIKTAEYQGEQLSKDELSAMSEEFYSSLVNSLFADAEEGVTEAVTE